MKTLINKKYIVWGMIALVVIAFIAIFSALRYKGNGEETRLSSYSLSLSYDKNSCTLKGEEKIEYVNNNDNMFSSLYFHLYPNAFREGAKNGVVSLNNYADAYPNGASYGKIEVLAVTYANGEPATYQICGEDSNILEVSLLEELYPEESVVLNISFETALANINHRLGYGENTINFGNFYPIACVYEEGKGFAQNLYHSNGDPFYSECANYEVEIEYDKIFEIASTGAQEFLTNNNEKVKAKYNAKNVRDFCFVLSYQFEKISKIHEGVEINYYGYKGDKNLDTSLSTCVDAFATFEKMFGEYPYSQLSVVKSNFVHGGMEYPNIVLISDTIEGQNNVNYVIIHEIAHQWWYGMVGNDEYNHAWIDEGLAEYSTLLFYREHPEYGEDFDALVSGALESYKLFEKVYTKVNGSVDGSMERALCEFSTEPEYVQCTYTKGVLMFNTLREMVGDKKFMSALEKYFKEFKFKNATPADLIAVFVDKCGNSVEGFLNSWLEGRVVIQ